jgi:hypothetical protein
MTHRTRDNPPAAPAVLLLELARRHLGIDTLEVRGRDDFDFHSVSVQAIRAALEEAYQAGLAAR